LKLFSHKTETNGCRLKLEKPMILKANNFLSPLRPL